MAIPEKKIVGEVQQGTLGFSRLLQVIKLTVGPWHFYHLMLRLSSAVGATSSEYDAPCGA
jgi:hypothetical protein